MQQFKENGPDVRPEHRDEEAMPDVGRNKARKTAGGDDSPRAGSKEERKSPKLREVSKEELEHILEEHTNWLESDGKEGQRADLANANLQGAALFEANLAKAVLSGANLRRSELSKANLQEANLSSAQLQGASLFKAELQKTSLVGANLSKARLVAANLQGASLTNANLFEANLREAKLQRARLLSVQGWAEVAALTDANFEGATGLLGTEFARKNITGTKLPGDIAEFKSLQVIEETSRNARKIFLAMLLGCVYSWLTIATTTDALLLTNSASSPLPIIGTEIPIASFYLAAPLILVAFYIYLHLYLQRLWSGLASLPARFPDGKSLDERAYPWLLNGLVRRHLGVLKENRPWVSYLEEWISIVLAWWTVPATLMAFWLRYLPAHEWIGTTLHIALILGSVVGAVVFYRLAARTLQGRENSSRTHWWNSRSYGYVGIVAIGTVLSALSFCAINGIRVEDSLWDPDLRDLADVRVSVPIALERIGYSTFANIRETAVSTKPDNYWELPPDVRSASVKGATLRNKDLRYADAVRAFLVNADLKEAKLDGADLWQAQLGGANLRRAQLVETDLYQAQLRGAQLSEADLTDADLRESDLREANLTNSKLTRTWLSDADLREARLNGANLAGVYLQGANLEGAILDKVKFGTFSKTFPGQSYSDLSDTKGLTQAQLDVACGDDGVLLPPGLSLKPCPKESE